MNDLDWGPLQWNSDSRWAEHVKRWLKEIKQRNPGSTLELRALNSHFCPLLVIGVLYWLALWNSSYPFRGAIPCHRSSCCCYDWKKVVPREVLKSSFWVLESRRGQMVSCKWAHMLLDDPLRPCLGGTSLTKVEPCSHGKSLRVCIHVMNLVWVLWGSEPLASGVFICAAWIFTEVEREFMDNNQAGLTIPSADESHSYC